MHYEKGVIRGLRSFGNSIVTKFTKVKKKIALRKILMNILSYANSTIISNSKQVKLNILFSVITMAKKTIHVIIK